MAVRPFFPDLTTAGVFFFVLVGLLLVAAWVDLRTYRIPKWLTLPLFGLGLVMNIARGAWMGSLGKPVWVLDPGSVWVGAADGFLFALWGGAFAFATYTGFWMLGAVKGGDVKLCTAIGAWIGAFNMILFLFASVFVLAVLSIGWVLTGGLTARRREQQVKRFRNHPDVRPEEVQKLARRGMSFSLAAAIAVALVMMWSFRFDLQLVQPKPDLQKGSVHAATHVSYR